jgi:ketosteroid isomerase-like protein
VEREMSDQVVKDLADLAHAWDRAMVGNDAEEIGRYMADEWRIIGPDGGVGDKETFLELVRSGKLTHDMMEAEEMDVRVHGDAAVVIARGISGGRYEGRPFREVVRSSCDFLRRDGRWRCVLTHLSRIAQEGWARPPSSRTRASGPAPRR